MKSTDVRSLLAHRLCLSHSRFARLPGIHVDGVLVLPDSATGGVVPLPSKSCLHVTADSDDRVFFLLPKRKKRVSTGSEGGTNKKGKVDVP